MRLARVTGLLICVVLVWGVLQNSAQAQTFGCYGATGFAYPGFFGYASNPYSLGQIPTPPYFSLHPPVYYSYPIPRTYGYSPYAYPGTKETPELVMPEVVSNPHATQGSEIDGTSNQAKVAQAQLIHNPFVRSSQLANKE